MNILTRLRRAKGKEWTQTYLAEKTGLSRATISGLENGTRKGTRNNLAAIEEALGLDAGTLDELRDTTAAERGRKGGQANAARQKEEDDHIPENRAA